MDYLEKGRVSITEERLFFCRSALFHPGCSSSICCSHTTMLTSIRERAQGWIAWLIIGLIIFVFAVWGIESFFTPNPNVPVLTVGGTDVGLREFQAAYQQQREHLQSLLGRDPEQVGLTDERIKQQVVDDFIERIVLANAAQNAGMRIGDVTLAAQIDAFDAFQVNGRFSRDRYEQALRNQGMTPIGFEQKMRGTLLLQQLYTGVAETAFVTAKQVDEHLRLQGQTREVAYLVLPSANFLEKAVFSEEDLHSYYRAHEDTYQVPEQVTIAYVELSAQALSANVAVTEAGLQAYYDDNRASYHQGEQRRASHILITVDEKADAATVAAAQAKIADLRRQIVAGASFEDLARANSQDPGSATKGGDLGFFDRSAMVKPFADAAFSMKEGEIGEPIRTPFGFHLIKLTGITPAHDQTFAEARPAVEQGFRRAQAEKQFFDRSDTIANLAYEHPDSLDPLATQLGLKVQTAGPFPRTGGASGLIADPKIVAAAFGEDVLVRGNNSEPVELPGNRLIVLRVTDHKPIRHQTLDEVRDAVTTAVRQEHAQSLAKAAGETMAKDLRAGKDPALIAGSAKLSWQHPGWINRQATGLPSEVREKAFQLSQPAASAATYDGLVLANGDFAVVKVTGVKAGDLATVTATAREDARRQLAKTMGAQDFASFVADLRATTPTVAHPERFERGCMAVKVLECGFS